jgi:hypothetical protein
VVRGPMDGQTHLLGMAVSLVGGDPRVPMSHNDQVAITRTSDAQGKGTAGQEGPSDGRSGRY